MTTYVESQWEVLRSGLENGTESRESLYRLVEEICLEGYANDFYERLALMLFASAQNKVREISADQIGLLQKMALAWETQSKETMSVRNICLYLDRSILHQGCPSLKEVGCLALRRALQSEPGLETAIITSLRQICGRVLRGEQEDIDDSIYQAASKCCLMLEDLGLYQEAFEPWIISEATDLYAADGRRLQCLNSDDLKSDALQYTHTVVSALKRVDTAVQLVFKKQSTGNKLAAAIEHQLIASHASLVLLNALSVLENETIKTLYGLIKRVKQEAKARLAAKQLAYTQACNILSSTSEEDKVQQLLNLRENLNTLFLEAMTSEDDDDTWAAAVLKDALEEALNEEARSTHVAEMLATFFAKTDQAQLEAAMPLFQCCRCKDVFEAFYRRELAVRLLEAQRAGSVTVPERERWVIARLQNECGASYISKLEGMCKDLELNADVISEYAKEDDDSIELLPLVLTNGYWPSCQSNETVLKLPSVMKKKKKHFTDFYSNFYRGRVLEWHHDLDRCQIHVAYQKSGKFTLDTSILQAIVLITLSGHRSMSMSKLCKTTGIVKIEPVLTSLQAIGLLRHFDTDSVTLAATFTSCTRHVRLPLSEESGTGLSNLGLVDRAKVITAVTRDRQYAIDAAIVRIMKTRKTLSHNLLQADILTALKHPASSTDIKSRIESLIQREYLERDTHEPSCYNYLA